MTNFNPFAYIAATQRDLDGTTDEAEIQEYDQLDELVASGRHYQFLPPLRGSEKQIAWAEKTRKAAYSTALSLASEADDSREGRRRDRALRVILSETSASFWIDVRDQNLLSNHIYETPDYWRSADHDAAHYSA